MNRTRRILTLATLMPLLLGIGAVPSKAQPPPPDPMFDDGPPEHHPPGDFEGPERRRGGGGRRGPNGRGQGGPHGHGERRGGGPKGRLNGVWHAVERLQSGPDALSKAQAAKLVALIKPWSSRATMSDTEAQKLAMGVDAVLTSDQKSHFGPPGRGGPPRGREGDFGPPPPPPRDGRGGPPRHGGDFGPPPPPGHDFGPPEGRDGGRGGRNGRRGGRRGGRVALPASYNPFYAPTGRGDWNTLPSSTQQLLARRYRENRAVLENLSRFSKS